MRVARRGGVGGRSLRFAIHRLSDGCVLTSRSGIEALGSASRGWGKAWDRRESRAKAASGDCTCTWLGRLGEARCRERKGAASCKTRMSGWVRQRTCLLLRRGERERLRWRQRGEPSVPSVRFVQDSSVCSAWRATLRCVDDELEQLDRAPPEECESGEPSSRESLASRAAAVLEWVDPAG